MAWPIPGLFNQAPECVGVRLSPFNSFNADTLYSPGASGYSDYPAYAEVPALA